MFRPEAYVAFLVLALMVIAKRIASGFRCLLIEPTARKDSTRGLDPHHGGTSTTVLDRRSAFKASLYPVVDVALARDVVVGNAVMRQMNDRVLPAARLSSVA
jgi:hypothetical protein